MSGTTMSDHADHWFLGISFIFFLCHIINQRGKITRGVITWKQKEGCWGLLMPLCRTIKVGSGPPGDGGGRGRGEGSSEERGVDGDGAELLLDEGEEQPVLSPLDPLPRVPPRATAPLPAAPQPPILENPHGPSNPTRFAGRSGGGDPPHRTPCCQARPPTPGGRRQDRPGQRSPPTACPRPPISNPPPRPPEPSRTPTHPPTEPHP